MNKKTDIPEKERALGAPTLEKIQQLGEYPDRRIKGIEQFFILESNILFTEPSN